MSAERVDVVYHENGQFDLFFMSQTIGSAEIFLEEGIFPGEIDFYRTGPGLINWQTIALNTEEAIVAESFEFGGGSREPTPGSLLLVDIDSNKSARRMMFLF